MTDLTKADEVDPRVVCFEEKEAERVFDNGVSRLMGLLVEQSRSQYMNENNVLVMNHGESWIHSATLNDTDTKMHRISAEWTIPFKDIADNDLSLIARTIQPISEEMQKQFAQNIYGMVSDAAEKVGNVVDARQSASFAESLREMLTKIELSVDRDGSVSMPQIHMHPSMFERMEKEMQSIPPELEAEIERLKAVKTQEAYDREDARKAKFKRPSE